MRIERRAYAKGLATAATLVMLASCGPSGRNGSAAATEGVTIDIPAPTPAQNIAQTPATVAPPAAPASREVAHNAAVIVPAPKQKPTPEPKPKPKEVAENAPAALEKAAPATVARETETKTETSPAPAAGLAKLPLPDGVVARTIERIGYPCGRVTSSSAVEGAGGAYKVTCSSGSSYRASTVRGHLRFREWGRR